jgi:hypothetical protein
MKQVVDFKNDDSIGIFIKIFRNQLYDQNGGTINVILRKASFIGFLSIANFLLNYENISSNTIYLLIQPLISSFKDNDPKIIVDAANTLIKILKNYHKVVLKFFNEIFEGLLIVIVIF